MSGKGWTNLKHQQKKKRSGKRLGEGEARTKIEKKVVLRTAGYNQSVETN